MSYLQTEFKYDHHHDGSIFSLREDEATSYCFGFPCGCYVTVYQLMMVL